MSRPTADLALEFVILSGSDDEHEDKEDLEDDREVNKAEFSSPKFLKSKLAISGLLLRLLFFLVLKVRKVMILPWPITCVFLGR